MKEYIVALEQEFSSIENGFKTEESRALQDFQSHDFAYCMIIPWWQSHRFR